MDNFNQKSATPLDFQKFFVKNIQKIKNGLCPSPPPLPRQSLPPRGSLWNRLTIFAEKNEVCWIFFRQGEAYEIGWPFLPKKMKFAEFFSGKGEPWRKAEFNLTSIGSQRLATFPVTVGFFVFSPLGEKAKKGKARDIKKAINKIWIGLYQSVMKQAKPAGREVGNKTGNFCRKIKLKANL